MRIKNSVYRLMGAICAFATVACVDDSFDVSSVSTEVTVGSGTTTIPLGYLEKKSIGDLLSNQEIAGLETDEEGNLSFKFSGEGDSIDVEGITTEFEIPEIVNEFTVEYPQFAVGMEKIEIDAAEDINVDLGVLDEYKKPDIGIDIPSFEIPDDVELPKIKGTFTRVFSEESDGNNMHIDVELPEQIDNVTKIFFKDMDEIHHGAPMHLRVDFNDLAEINGGGELKFSLSIAGGKFTLLNADNKVIHADTDGEFYTEKYVIEDGAESVDFTIFVESITNDKELTEDHHLDLPMEVTYDMEFEVQAKPGNFDLKTMPHIELEADFEYRDAEMDVNNSVALVEYHHEQPDPIAIEGLPEQIKTVNRVTLTDGGIFEMHATGLEWLDEEVTKDLEVIIDLPDYLVLHEIEHSECHYDEVNHRLISTIEQMGDENGLRVAIEALDFGAEGRTPDENGNFELEFALDFVVDFTEDARLLASELEHEGDLDIEVSVAPTMLNIASVSGCVEYEYAVDEVFELQGLDQLDVEIGGVGLKPVIEVSVSNPLTMPAMLEGSIIPISGGMEVEKNGVEIPTIELASATFDDGEIKPADITLIIADESLRNNYRGPQYTFVACDVAKLLLGRLPEALNINLSLSVDENTVHTIHVADTLSVQYEYKVDVPIAFDNSLEITYNSALSGLNPTFDLLSGYDIKVGDVAIIATVTNTTPLQFAPSVALFDVDGNRTEAQAAVAEGSMILGSSDGETPAESVLRLDLILGGDGSVSNIAEIDGVSMKLVATSAAEEDVVSLKDSQYLSVKLQLELDGGITIDLGSFITGGQAEE